MAKLFGAQKMVLQAIVELPKDATGFVTDVQIAQRTRIALTDVRDWIETLEGEGHVDSARTTSGLSASITAQGRLQLGLYQPIAPPHAESVEIAVTGRTLSPITGSVGSTIPSSTVASPSDAPASASPSTDSMDGFQVVLLIHGIRTQADWGPMVRSRLEVPGQIEVIPIKYGYFDAFRFWLPFWTRTRPIERVYTQIRVATPGGP